MTSFRFFSFVLLVLASVVAALPREGISNDLGQRYQVRRQDIPTIPPRPEGVGAESFHGSQFQFFDEHGFVAGSPGVEAAPVFLFSRTQSIYDPCYPESAIVLGSNPPKPNPGSRRKFGTGSVNPGAHCTNPGPYDGAYSHGNRFPVYMSAAYCGDSWRVNYDLYYVHDGVIFEGHRHDWEGVTVVFKKDPSGVDWWHRQSVIFNKHGWHDHYIWDSLETVQVDIPGNSDVRDETVGNNKNHPKVYVGFFSHSAFAHRCDKCRHTDSGAATEYIANQEYRSNDWWRLPRGEDMHLWSEINRDWDYGSAWSSPPRNRDEMCSW